MQTQTNHLIVSCTQHQKAIERCNEGVSFFNDLMVKVDEVSAKLTEEIKLNKDFRNKFVFCIIMSLSFAIRCI